MTLNKAGFPGSVTDIQWSKLIDLLGHDGTLGMNVSVASGDRTVRVSEGISNVGAILADLDAPMNVGPLPANTGSFARLDRIILRAKWSDKSLTLTYRQGTPSSNPQPPTLTKDPGVQYEVRLCQVRVEPGTGNLSTGDLFAEKVPPVSGFYNSSGFRGFPDADNGSLVWYQAAESLRVPVDGEYVEIANARAAMRPRHTVSGSDITLSGSGSYEGGSPSCGMTFVAPPIGSVIVSMFGQVEQNQNGGRTYLSFEIRNGDSIGLGGVVWAASDEVAILAGESVTSGAPARAAGTVSRMITDLTPGNTYNVRTMHRMVASTGGGVFYRYLLTEPVA